MIDELIFFLTKYIADWGYLIAFLASLLENSIFLGLFVPGEIITLLSGFYAGQGILFYPLVLIIILTSSAIGDNIGFWIGRKFGKKWLKKVGPKIGQKTKKIERAEIFWDKQGEKAIIAGRFMAFARTFVPFFAGSSKIKYRKFFLLNLAGATVHSVTMVTLGYYFGENWEAISAAFGTLGVLLLAIFIVSAYKYIVKRKVEKK